MMGAIIIGSIIVGGAFLILCFGFVVLFYIFPDVCLLSVYSGKLYAYLLKFIVEDSFPIEMITIILVAITIFIHSKIITYLYDNYETIFNIYSLICSIVGTIEIVTYFNLGISFFKFKSLNIIATILMYLFLVAFSIVTRDAEFKVLSKKYKKDKLINEEDIEF